MTNLPYLNLGCGRHFDNRWVNVDFIKTGDDVIAHNLLNGIPFADESFEVVYHSHVLEHFPKDEAVNFIKECYRVLKPGGIIRIAVPDLEQIVAHYTRLLQLGKADAENPNIRADYNWIITEMYDQTVRDQSGGQMAKILTAPELVNEEFIMQRVGHEGKTIRHGIIGATPNNIQQPKSLYQTLFNKIKNAFDAKRFNDRLIRILFKQEYGELQLGRFRRSGEIHQWMYDSYSLSNLLRDTGFKNIEKKQFDTSAITNWQLFGLDEFDNAIRKPDSLFVEAVK